jgi:hypothetical protein
MILLKKKFEGDMQINKSFSLTYNSYKKIDEIAKLSNITFSASIRRILELSIQELFPDEDYTFLKREGRKIIYKKKFPQGKK